MNKQGKYYLFVCMYEYVCCIDVCVRLFVYLLGCQVVSLVFGVLVCLTCPDCSQSATVCSVFYCRYSQEIPGHASQ